MLGHLTGLSPGEVALRHDRSVQRRIQDARFPVIKTMAGWDWNWPAKDAFCPVEFHDDGFVAQRFATAFKKLTDKARLNILEREVMDQADQRLEGGGSSSQASATRVRSASAAIQRTAPSEQGARSFARGQECPQDSRCSRPKRLRRSFHQLEKRGLPAFCQTH